MALPPKSGGTGRHVMAAAILICSNLAAMAGNEDDLPFRIDLWDDKDSHIEEVIAMVGDYATAYRELTFRHAN